MSKTNYYISDLHLNCTNKYEGRTLDHDKLIKENWNHVVTNADTVYILGDIGREGGNKDNEYLGMNIAYNNIMKMYPQLRWYVDFAIKNKKTGLILFALKLYRIVKFNLLYNFSSHYKPTVVRALV